MDVAIWVSFILSMLSYKMFHKVGPKTYPCCTSAITSIYSISDINLRFSKKPDIKFLKYLDFTLTTFPHYKSVFNPFLTCNFIYTYHHLCMHVFGIFITVSRAWIVNVNLWKSYWFSYIIHLFSSSFNLILINVVSSLPQKVYHQTFPPFILSATF